MHFEADALVLRSQNYRESDRLCTLLTKSFGVINAYARGARNLKNRNFSSTSQLSYARFTIFSYKDSYCIDESQSEYVFTSVLSDLERLALAQYLCELSAELAPPDSMSEPYLMLMLRALHALSDSRRTAALVKAATEMRMLSLSGYMPDLVMCSGCGLYESDLMYFMPSTGTIRCSSCGADGPGVPLTKGALTAMRHCIYTDLEKTFSFSLAGESLSLFADASERYLTSRLECGFPTLDFYHAITSGGQ